MSRKTRQTIKTIMISEEQLPTQLFLTLDDAVAIAVRHFDVDEDFARSELEQKCWVSDDQYSIGYCDGLNAAVNTLEQLGSGFLYIDKQSDSFPPVKDEDEISII